MKNTIINTLILLILCVAMVFSTLGCSSKTENPSSSSSTIENTSSADDEITTEEDDVSSDDSDSEADEWDDTLENLTDEPIEDEYIEELTVLNAKAPVTKEFLGINGVHMMFEYLKDDAGSGTRDLTEEQINTHADRIQEMGVTIVRSIFSSSTAWNGKTQSFDWNSENFKGFIKSCKLYQDRGIDLAVSPGLWSLSGVFVGQDGNDLETPNPSQLAGHGIVFRPCMNNKYELDEDALRESMQNYRNFMTEYVKQFAANGIHNIKYFMAFTEVNQAIRGAIAKPNGEDNTQTFKIRHYPELAPVFGAAITTLDESLKDVGMRDKYKIVAPCDNWGGDFEIEDPEAYSYLIRYCLENLSEEVDIIGTHRNYAMGNDFTDDIYYDFPIMALDSTREVTANANKPLWLDEYGVSLNGISADSPEERRTYQRNLVKGVAFGSMVNSVMNMGVDNCIIWQIDNQQWPNNSNGYEFDNGMQVGNGYLPSPLESMTPYPAWYSFSMISKYVSRGEVYECTVGYGVYMSCIKRTDGEWTIVVTNHNVDDVNAKIMLEKSVGGKTFYRHRYTTAIVPTPSAAIIGVDAVAKNVTTGFYDTLPGFSVSVYTTVKD